VPWLQKGATCLEDAERDGLSWIERDGVEEEEG